MAGAKRGERNEISKRNSLPPSRPRRDIDIYVTTPVELNEKICQGLSCSAPSLMLSLDKRVKAWGRGCKRYLRNEHATEKENIRDHQSPFPSPSAARYAG